MKISVCLPSYKREKVKTLEYLPFARVYVCETETEVYQKANPGATIISCKKGIQGNVARIRNHILNTEFAAGADCVCLIDDDVDGIFYYESKPQSAFGFSEYLVSSNDFLSFIERYTVLCQDFGFKLWGVNLNYDPQAYCHFRPFNTTNIILGPFSCHLAGSECRYDETLPLKEDYDIALQHLNRYRGILRLNKYHYRCKQSVNPGGCASIRSMEKEREQFKLLQQKWGSEIVRKDKSSKHQFDYNPIVKSFVKGV